MYLSRSVIGGLMHEHQVILRVVESMRAEAEAIAATGETDPLFVEEVVDFIRTYADRCHHGKEEDILFAKLETVQLSAEDAAAMRQLMDDHVRARGLTRELAEAGQRFAAGESAATEQVRLALQSLVDLYPGHIVREDRGFFRAVAHYLTRDELEAMAVECAEFERSLIHEKYVGVAERLEARRNRST